MELTQPQWTAIKNYITADPTLNALASDASGAALRTIADALNAPAVPDFIVWRTDIRGQEIVNAIDGAEYVALTAVKQNLLLLLITPGTIDASKPNIRADFSAMFGAGNTLTALTALAKRKATVLEKLLATGTGSTASPATMAVEGRAEATDSDRARRA